MKKGNILSLFIFALCVLVLTGVSSVDAAANYHVVCWNELSQSDSIAADETADCYIIGDFDAKIEGVVAKVKDTTKYLVLHNGGTVHTGVVTAKLSRGQKVADVNASITTDAKNYECTNNDGCFVFTAIDSAVGIAPNKISSTSNDVPALNSYSSFTNIGHITVSLSADAPATDCGQLCVDIQEVATAAGYTGAPVVAATDACDELTPKGGGGSDTGSFASYTILIGGAFVAIAAIAIARKNNKFYKI